VLSVRQSLLANSLDTMDAIESISSVAPIWLVLTICIAAVLAFLGLSAVVGSTNRQGHSESIHYALLHGGELVKVAGNWLACDDYL
jgi:hypothetical protein